MKRLFALCSLLSALCAFGAAANAAPNLAYTVAAEQTAETALAAKSSAMNNARRQAFNSILSRYSDRSIVERLSEDMTDAELLDFIGTTSIADEKTSATAYSANITITLDRAAAEKWLRVNNVPNYLAAADDSGPRSQVFFHISGGLNQWVALAKDLRGSGVWSDLDLKVSSIWGQNVSATIAGGRRYAFVSAVRNLGWKVSEEDGIVRVSK